jgi:hypothetical protein
LIDYVAFIQSTAYFKVRTSSYLGPFFNEVSLAQIALDLDKKERTLMLEQGLTQ